MDDFDLAPDLAVQPLDIPTMPGAGAPPTQQPPTAGKGGMGQLAKMLPLIAAAMKQGGRPGVAAFLQGVQRAKAARQGQDQQTFQNDRLTQQDQRLAANDQAAESYRQQQLAGQAQQRQIAFAKQAQEAIASFDNPEALRHYLDLIGPQAEAVGISRAALERYAMQTATPTRLQQTAAEKKLAAIQKQHGVKWTEEGPKFTYVMADSPTDPQTGQQVGIPFEELLRRAGQARDPNAPQAAAVDPFEGNTQEKAHLAAFARGRGKTVAQLTDVEIEQAMSRQDATRRDPQRQPIQITVGGSGLTPQQVSTGAGLRDDFRTESKDFFSARDGYERLLSAAQDPSPAGDVALLYGFMKLLDPNSVVRETEFATAAKTGSLPQQIQAAAERVVNGQRLTREQRADFMNRAKWLFGRAQNRHNSRKTNYEKIATRSGVPVDLVVMDDAPVDESVLEPTAASPKSNPFRR